MVSVAYHLSGSLLSSLEQIHLLRQQILLTPLPPRLELRYRWEAMIDKIYWSLNLANVMLSRREIVDILMSHGKKQLSPTEKDVHRYKFAFDHLYQDWLGSNKYVSARTVLSLHEVISRGDVKDEAAIKLLLDYLQSSAENPVIQAAIVMNQLLKRKPFTHGNEEVARLSSYVFLYRQGYDVRGLLVMEEHFRKDRKTLSELVHKASEDENITPWLEFFANGMVAQLEKVKTKIAERGGDTQVPNKPWELTDRQRTILGILEEPGSRVTNRKIQKLFYVSQITASRDLARLVALGVIFPRGKGRSVYYTRV